MSSEKKVALITGANRGIGLETARQLGHKSVTIVVGARDLKAAEDAVATLVSEGVDAYPVQLDVTKDADRKAAAKYVDQKFGKLDILINNAAIGVFDNKTIDEPEDRLLATFDTNFFSLIALTRELLPLLKKSEAGRIVNLSSILGSLTLHSDPKSPIAGSKSFAYDASKTALNAFTVHLAVELKGTNIKVNSAHPGWVKTELGGAGAQMEIPDGAKTSVELALIGPDGPTGRYIHLGNELPW